MKYQIVEIKSKDKEGNYLIQRFIDTDQGLIHLPIKWEYIEQKKDENIINIKTIGEIDLELPYISKGKLKPVEYK